MKEVSFKSVLQLTSSLKKKQMTLTMLSQMF